MLVTVSVENSDTVKAIREKLQEQFKIPMTKQCLILGWKVLEDECIISDCNIKCSKLNIKLKIGKNVVCIYVLLTS